MKIIKAIFGGKGSRVWFIVSVSLLALFLVASVLLTGPFGDVFMSVLGGRRAVYADGVEAIYVSDYQSKAEALAAANAYNEKICEEGFVLLKNKDNALPIYTPATEGDNKSAARPRVSVFGKNSVNIAYGGSGSGGGSGGSDAADLYGSLTAAGYDVNPALRDFYADASASGSARPVQPESANLDDGKTITVPTYETPLSSYPASVTESYGEYGDAAIVVLSRMGGEGFDLPRVMDGVAGARKADDHYLQLDKNETDLLQTVTAAGFGKVVLVLNIGTSFELGFLREDTNALYNALKEYDIDGGKIDAAVWTGFPGNSGMTALGRILNGSVSPSGRTTDTYALDFKADPTWNNFADNLMADGDRYMQDGAVRDYYFVDYEESVYVGYRYYETRGADEGGSWYDENVVYPFGYGLSYTTFAWSVEDDGGLRDATAEKDRKYELKIRVTNTGGVKGREVVQLYGHAPFTEFQSVQKPYEVLLDFAKTEELEPGESEVVTLTADPYYLASYDYDDANGNGFAGYELEAGDYELFVSRNAHEKEFTLPFTMGNAGIAYAADPVTGYAVGNRYTGLPDAVYNSDYHLTASGSSLLQREFWEENWPTSPVHGSTDDRATTGEFLSVLQNTDVTTLPGMPDYSEEPLPAFGKTVTLTYRDMVTDADGTYAFGEGETDRSLPFASFDDVRWETLLDQCTAAGLLAMRDSAAFNSGALEQIGKPLTNDTDGPAGFVNFMLTDGTYHDTCYYASQMVVASTWSKEIAEGFGRSVGNEGLWGADGKGNGMPYSGWYAPGANIHRSPFGGRNFEYMSEDGLLTGKMAAAQIRGCQSRGVYCFMKHFALNDQETHRSSNGISVWVTEQAMREIYLKPFEIAVKEGGTRAVMSSFNRIGSVWAGGDYRLLTEILRNEWGFRGTVVSDFTSGAYMNSRQMAYAGGDLNLNNQEQYKWRNFDAADPADAAVLRLTAKNVLYTVLNSNAMNGEVVGYRLPLWQILLIVADCALFLGLAVWGFFAVRGSLKKAKDREI